MNPCTTSKIASHRPGRAAGWLAPLALAALLLVPLRLLPAQEATGWVGQRVILQFDSVLRVGNTVVDNQKREARSRGGARNIVRIYRVEQVNGPWLWLRAEKEGASGWIRAAEVIRYDQAIDYFTSQIRAKPANYSAYLSRGRIWHDKKEYDIALADFTEAIRLDPGSEIAYNNRGLAWSAKSEYDTAIADYGEAIRLDPRYAIAYYNRGNAWSAKSEYDRAIADYGEAIRLDPRLAPAYTSRGRSWSAKSEYDKAIADYGEAIRLDPRYALAYYNRGNAWRAKSEYDKAIAAYDEAIRLDPKNASAYFDLAVLDLITRRDGATAGMRRVVELEKGKGELSAYAVILGHLAARRAGDDKAAREFLGPLARDLDPGHWPDPIVRFLRGERDEPQLLALAVDIDKTTEARCYLGLHHDLEGRGSEAMAHYRWVKEQGKKTSTEYMIAVVELARLESPAGRVGSRSVARAPEPAPAPADTRVARLLETVMYVPTPQLQERFGTDAKPLADYVHALKTRVAAILAAAEPVPAQGLLVAVGLKTNRRSKVWSQAVEGTIPPALLKTLERELGEVEPVTLKSGTAGFGLKLALSDKTPSAFPSAPERWTDAAASTRSKTISPPDDLFRILWPD